MNISQDIVDDLAQRFGLPGVQIGYRGTDGKLSVFQSGVSSSAGAPVREDTLFAIGSIGKLYTALTVAQACDAGAGTLDQVLGDRLPHFRFPLAGTADVPALTLRQLLSHAGGIKEPLRDTDPASSMAVVSGAQASGLLFEPGRAMSWSNAGFVVAGAALEHLVGSRFEDLAEVVLEPLGLENTTITPAGALGRPVANTYDNPSFRWMAARWQIPAGITSFSTAFDLLRLAEIFCVARDRQQPILISEASRQALLRTTLAGVSGYSAAYDLCPLGRMSRSRVLFVSGSTEHGFADLRMNPVTGEVLVGLSQSPGLERTLTELQPDFALPTMTPDEFPEREPIATGELAGRYAADLFEIAVTADDGDGLVLQQRRLEDFTKGPRTLVRPRGGGIFLKEIADGRVEPVRFMNSRGGDGYDLLHVSGRAYRRIR